MLLFASLGTDSHSIWDNGRADEAVMSKMILSKNKSGILSSISYTGPITEDMLDLQLFAKPGTLIHAFKNSSHCIGQVIVKGANPKKCEELADMIIDNVNVLIS